MRISILACFFIMLTSCKGSKSVVNEFQSHQIEINLHDKVKPKKMEADFGLYGLKVDCIIDSEKNIVVYSFDQDFASIDVLIELMSNEVGVESVSKTRGCIH